MTTETEITATVIPDPAPAGWVLKSYKEIKSMSEETLCFSARLYIDGKLACDLSNHGHGGPNSEHWASPEMKTLAMATVSGTHDLSEYGNPDPLDDDACFEITVGEMCEDISLQKDIKRVCKKGAFPIGVFAEDGPYSGFIFGLRNLDNLGKFLVEHKVIRYRVFHL